MNINFFEGESRRFGIVFNQDYDVSRLSEVKLEIRARNTEIFLSFSESDGLTVDETGHVYIASIEPADTLYKVGEYKMQISFVDSEIGLRKSKIYDMSIMKSVVSSVTEATINTDLIDFLIEINVNESVSFSENWDINIIDSVLSDTVEAAGIAEAKATIATTKASEAAESAASAINAKNQAQTAETNASNYAAAALESSAQTSSNSVIAQKTNVFVGNADATIVNFLYDIRFTGLVLNDTDVLYVENVRRARQYTTPTNFVRHLVRIALNGTNICVFVADSYTEPAADAKGNRIDTITLAAEPSSGITAIAVVNWAALTNNSELSFTSTTDRQKTLLSPKISRKNIGADTSSLLRGNRSLESNLAQIERTDIFKGAEILDSVSNFLIDIKFSGLTIPSKTSQVSIFNLFRAFPNPTIPRWVFDIAVDGVRVCQFFADNYTEPALVNGRRIATLTLAAFNSSGVTAMAIVDWEAISSGFQATYSSTTDRLKTLLSEKTYHTKVSDVVGTSTTAISRGASNLEQEISRLEKTSVFKGASILTSLTDFLLAIEFSNLTLPSKTSQVHLNNVWRAFPNPTIQRWVLDVAVDGVRVCQFLADNYTEPALVNGRRIATLTLAAFNSSGVTATAIVDWEAISSGFQATYNSTTDRLRGLLSEKTYIPKIASVNASNILNGGITVSKNIANIETNNVLIGDGIDDVMRNAILGIKFFGKRISTPANGVVHIDNVRRKKNYTTPSVFTRSLIRLSIDGAYICTWFSDTYVEPTADANGNIFDALTLTSENNSGITAIVFVNWAALPLDSEYSYNAVSVRKKGWISPNIYNQALNAKAQLFQSTTPNRLYTVLGDLDNRNNFTTGSFLRQDLVRPLGLSLYVDRFLRGVTLDSDITFSESGSDKHRIYSRRRGDLDVLTEHGNPTEVTNDTVTIDGGTNYNSRTFSFSHVSTRESAGASSLVKCLTIGDSTVYGLNTEVGVPDGYAHKAWGVIHEQFVKAKIDYLLSQGYTATQIQNNTISDDDKAKYNIVTIGTVSDSMANDVFTVNYRGVSFSYNLKAEGKGSWAYYMYINKPMLCRRAQGTWDLLGLGNGSGTDYTGSAEQMYLFDRTAWNPDNIVDTAAMRSWFQTTINYVGSTRADYVAKALDIENNSDNPFYDKDKTDVISDGTNNWQVKFSIGKYLSRWRTMSNDGVRLTAGNSAIGTKVGSNLANFDVTLPSHIIMQSCQNDQNVTHFGIMAKVFADAVKAEYAANAWGVVNVGLSIIDGAGTYFPKRYPEIGAFATMDDWLRAVHNDNLARLQAAITNEDANRVFVLANTFIIPTAESTISRNGDSVEYEITGNYNNRYFIPSRTSPGIKGHINAVGNRPIGVHHYAWIKYTLSLA
ncbi:hypothetical protein GCM10027035_47810 [Emticicia sediminis]